MKKLAVKFLAVAMMSSVIAGGAVEAQANLNDVKERILDVTGLQLKPVNPVRGSDESCAESYLTVLQIKNNSTITVSLGAQALVMGLTANPVSKTITKDRTCQRIELVARHSKDYLEQDLTQTCGRETFRYLTQVQVRPNGIRVTRTMGDIKSPKNQVCEYLYEQGKG